MNKDNLLAFYKWTNNPGSVYTLQEILVKLTNEELLEVVASPENTAAAKIAWAEYGRRLGYADITFRFRTENILGVDIKDAVLAFGVGRHPA